MMRFQAFSRIGLLACAIGLLTGCNVGPKYVRPNATAPVSFRGADDAPVSGGAAKSLGDEQWSAVYQEPELQALIRKALANNYDVRIAAQHISSSRRRSRSLAHNSFRPSQPAEPVLAPLCLLRSGRNFPVRWSTARLIYPPHGRPTSGGSIVSRPRPPAPNCWHKPGHSVRFV